MPETSKSKDFESVSISVNNKTYTKMMRRDEALAYKERQRLIGEVVPGIWSSFSSLIERLDAAFANLGVPKSLAVKLIGNEKIMYNDFVKPGVEARIGAICREHITESGVDIEKAENEAKGLKDMIDACIEETKNSIGDGRIGFHDTAVLSYEKLKKSIAEILGIKTY